MPIGLQTPLQGHTGNGVTTTFAYNFGILAAADLKVRVAGSIVTSGYSVTGTGNRAGGTVVFSTAPGSGVEVLLYRSVSRDRSTDYQTNGDLRADVLDDDLDRIVMALQEDAEILTRCVRAPTGESLGELAAADSRANKVLTFGAGGGIVLVDLAAFAGGGVVELVPADGSITLTKLATAVQSLINGALQRTGGTMAGPLVLEGNATAPLHPATKQQLDATVRADLSPLSVTVAANAMTCALPAETINFRSTTLNDGAAFARTYAGGSLTVPSGATLGTTNGAAARLVWGLIDNAGTPEPFVVNAGGTANLDESTLISTTAISGSANNPNTFYSQTARSNVAFRIRGWCDITQATAGTWATAPTRVCGASIQTLKSIQGRGRTPQNVLASRTFGVTYYNTTPVELFAHVNIQWASGVGAARLVVDGINFDGPVLGAVNQTSQVNAPVPPGGAYTFNGTNSIGFTFLGWNESRQG